ncbi:hypothetical protein ADK67_05480 [Saccharothrix sp. NRRL B-16348]|uniref:hypothetical protein n=1 Tax=Saccharothrix sp. NRRL B-16348 TaxID=1415542 RepID=UPI0006B057DC|nr:hypothetical protein [Saccharothrix sp. NRRL B-16348]KOX33788.1 hypothetical protein ADK67_05480 [Saccharothrix sp. NRRL B-16348]
MNRTLPEITADCFPTPHLALRGTADDAQVRAFAAEQASAARAVLPAVASALALPSTRHAIKMLTLAYDTVVSWRRAVAATADDARYDAAGRPTASRYAVTIDEGGSNCDRLGEVGRLRTGARWDTATGRWTGGTHTPASRVLAAYGHAARHRFEMEIPHSHDVLINNVWLPVTGRRIQGNMLLRREAARELAGRLAVRLAQRRGVTEVETTGDLLYAVTASPEPRRVMFREAMHVLAAAYRADRSKRWSAWWSAAYLLYQAPTFKKGSDACNRVFLAAVGAALLDQAPVIPHDLDLRCMVLGQSAVTVAMPLVCEVAV